ncbi:MAG: Asp-tRNA(Asn)/Glu-tRNA(Gln) amidotransferase subunit GatA [bacterium]|nr:Asp-tRNA(Asn)/Glu-tRNA(Gln) amidotransferase subunit GatA [bacterium]
MSHVPLHNLTIKKFHDGLLKKEFSALEIAQDFFKWIEKQDQVIDAYLSLDKDGAFRTAEAVDIKIAQNENVPLLAGVPLAIKDNLLIEGLPATAGSKILENYRASYDATVITKLKKAGAVFLGKTNMDEFAMGSSTETSAFKKTKNPHDISKVPGGSSGGSAAAVAAHMAVAALGTDTGGSIRQPAAFCGVVGLKPTYGAVSRYGAIAMASSLDQIGPFTKTVEDAAMLFQTIAGHDTRDATSVSSAYHDPSWSPTKFEDLKKLTIGIPEEYFEKGLDKNIGEQMDRVIKDIESFGIKTKRVSLPHTKYALSCYYIIMPAEVSSNLERFDGIRYGTREKADTLLELYKKNREAGFGAEAKRRIILGTFVLSSGYYDAYYARAQKVRRLIAEDFDRVFKDVDMLLTPVTPTRAFTIGEKIDDPLAMYLSDIFTIPVNLAGLPAISIPVRGVEGLPIGFQLIGKQWREADILGVGQYYERL